MKFYVASKFERKEEVREVYKKIETLGHNIAYDWTTHQKIKPFKGNISLAQRYSERELEGIAKTDVFVYLSDKDAFTSLMELGAAMVLNTVNNGRPVIYVVGKYITESPWFYNDKVRLRNSINGVLEEYGKK